MTNWGARSLAACAAALSLTLAVGAPALADTQPPKPPANVNQQIGSLRDQVAEASAEESDLLGRIDTTTASLADAQAKVSAFDATISTTTDALVAAQNRLHQLSDQVDAAEASVAAANAQLEQSSRELRAQAVEAYVSGPRGTLTDLAEAVSSNDVSTRVGYVAAVVDAQERLIARYRALHTAAKDARSAVAATQAKEQDEADAIVKQKTALESARADQDAVRQKAQDDSSHLAQLLTEVKSRKAEFQAQIAQLQVESDQIASFLRTAQSGQVAPTSAGHGVFAAPIPAAPITSGFGPRVHPIFGDVRIHTGIDFGAAEGTPIMAAGDGVVVSAGPLGGYGNGTVIDHGRALATLYGHQSRILVTAGQHVKRGQVIGLVGHTGFATGPHLHFEVRVAGNPVDPTPYL